LHGSGRKALDEQRFQLLLEGQVPELAHADLAEIIQLQIIGQLQPGEDEVGVLGGGIQCRGKVLSEECRDLAQNSLYVVPGSREWMVGGVRDVA
jgi:hypothetical protein